MTEDGWRGAGEGDDDRMGEVMALLMRSLSLMDNGDASPRNSWVRSWYRKEGLGKESADGNRAAAKAKFPITYQTCGHRAERERRQGPREAGAKEIR